jgi:hypothetical protein
MATWNLSAFQNRINSRSSDVIPTGSPPPHRVHLAAPSDTKTFYIVPAALAASTFNSIPQNLFIKWNRYAASYTVLPVVNGP